MFKSKTIGMESVNRARPKGYKKYMQSNPEYFEVVANKKATLKNIEDEFESLQKKFLVAAHRIPHHCKCNNCKDKPERRSRFYE